MQQLERYRGCLLGLATGDALGAPIQFQPPGTFAPIDDMVGGGTYHLAPGQWTDDTSMALCLAESLIERQGFDPIDQLQRYVRSWQEGYLSSTGYCFDMGNATYEALARFVETGEPYCGSEDPWRAGNGSLMRLAPVPMAYARRPAEAIERCAESSRTTHATLAAVDACRYFGGLLVGALNGVPKEELLAARYAPVPDYWTSHPLVAAVDRVAAGSFKERQPPEIQGRGYVVDCLEAALWAFYHSDSVQEGCLLAVNLGDDADTTGAVYGQLAGAYYGEQAIPPTWRACLTYREQIEAFAEALHRLSERLDNTEQR